MPSYDANSSDAMFSRIMQRLDKQDEDSTAHRTAVKEELAYIRSAVDKTNGRVTSLEREKWRQRGFITAIGLAISAAWEWINRSK